MKNIPLAFLLITFIFFKQDSFGADTLSLPNILKLDTINYSFEADTLKPKFTPEENWITPLEEGSIVKYKKTDNIAWRFYLLAGLGILIGFTRLTFYKDFRELIESFLNYNLANQFYRDHEASQPFSFLLLNINFIIVTSMILIEIFNFYEILDQYEYWILLGILISALGILILLRAVIFEIMKGIFTFNRELNLYNFHIGIIYKMLGLVLYPVIILFTFSPEPYKKFLIPGVIVLIVSFLFFRYIRGMAIASGFIKFYKFHFFLYICTLEIAPLLLMIKLIVTRLY